MYFSYSKYFMAKMTSLLSPSTSHYLFFSSLNEAKLSSGALTFESNPRLIIAAIGYSIHAHSTTLQNFTLELSLAAGKMSKLRILVPVKRVIDYAVRFPHPQQSH